MIPCSDLFQESMRYSHTSFSQMDILYNGVVLENDVPISSGSFTTDRTSNIRYNASVEIGMYPWDSIPVTSKGTRVRLWRGVTSIGTKERVQVGEYQVFNYKRTNRGTVSTSLKGLENFIIESEFIKPRTPPYGQSTLLTIQQLITEVLPTAQFVITASTDKIVSATGAWEKDRWGAVTALAASISADIWCGYDGRWYITDVPDLGNLVGQYQIDGGPAGVMIEENREDTRDQVYNAVSVSSQSSDQTVPPLWAWAYDSDPTSDTYFYGPYGQRVRFFSSQFFTTVDQCQAYATRLLIQSLAPNQSLAVGVLPIPFLESGDPILVVSEMGVPKGDYLVQKTTVPLGGGNMSIDVYGATTNDATFSLEHRVGRLAGNDLGLAA
jgi:hypothetical protein